MNILGLAIGLGSLAFGLLSVVLGLWELRRRHRLRTRGVEAVAHRTGQVRHVSEHARATYEVRFPVVGRGEVEAWVTDPADVQGVVYDPVRPVAATRLGPLSLPGGPLSASNLTSRSGRVRDEWAPLVVGLALVAYGLLRVGSATAAPPPGPAIELYPPAISIAIAPPYTISPVDLGTGPEADLTDILRDRVAGFGPTFEFGGVLQVNHDHGLVGLLVLAAPGADFNSTTFEQFDRFIDAGNGDIQRRDVSGRAVYFVPGSSSAWLRLRGVAVNVIGMDPASATAIADAVANANP